MTLALIVSTLVILALTIIVCGWIHRTRDRDARAWAQELLENGLTQKPPVIVRTCAICGEYIGHDEKVDYCRDRICHSTCYEEQVKT